MVVNKPSGMVVHPAQGTGRVRLVNGLVLSFQSSWMKAMKADLGLVHRSTGIPLVFWLIAKSETAMTSSGRTKFFHHTTRRRIMALVWGELEGDSGTTVEMSVRSFKDRKVWMSLWMELMASHAVTHWKVVEGSCAKSP